MTLLMVWRDVADERVWLTSDGRLSSQGSITDMAGKILSIPVAIHQTVHGMLRGPTIRATSFAFAYAGSSLIAAQTYTAVLPLWAQLYPMADEFIPSPHQLAEHMAIFLNKYCESASAHAGRFQKTTLVLVGPNDRTARVEGWLLETVMRDQVEVVVKPINLEPGQISLLGSGATWAEKHLPDYERYEDGLLRREPLNMLRDHLRTDPAGDVGGAIQLAYVTQYGCELTYDVQPVIKGRPEALGRFRGFDIGEINRVGDSYVGLSGIA